MGTYNYDLVEELTHPVDLAEALAMEKGWLCSRDNDEELFIEFEGLWRFYRVLVCLIVEDELLEFRSGFEMKLNKCDPNEILRIVNQANKICNVGSFTVHCQEEAFIFGCSQVLVDGDSSMTVNQIEKMIKICIAECEKFYPAFQLVSYGSMDADSAIDAALLNPVSEC